MNYILRLVNSPVKLKVRRFSPNIYHLEFESRRDLTSTLVRFQEHYESPKFRNKIFSLEKFVEWYRSKKKRFTYFSDWEGFNFPSYVLKPFYEGKFDVLTTREKQVLDLFTGKKNFYVIGTYKSDSHRDNKSTKKHEIAHAMFYLNKKYRASVEKELSKIDLRPICRYLKRIGYHKEVFVDECHAYLLTEPDDLSAHGIELPLGTIKKLESFFQKYK
jgi:hypothetical protein